MSTKDAKPHHLISVGAVLERIAVSRTTLDIMVRSGEFPRPLKIRGRIMWPEQAVDQWITERFAEANANRDRSVAKPRGRPRKTVLPSTGT